MLEWFKCPDSQVVEVKQCLTKCRMEIDCPICGGDGRGIPTLQEPDGAEAGCERCNGTGKITERCLTLPTLTMIADEREWNGIPSTTQLLNGTMQEFLKLTKPYMVDPDSRAFMLAGTKHHQALSIKAKELGLMSEVALTTGDRDIFDLLEPGDGGWTITDYKLWGSYRVVKALGLVEVGKKPDPSGEVYKKSGTWGQAGSPKMVSVFQPMAQEVDLWETELQLNHYRVMLEERGLVIGKMQIQITVRDGGLAVATSRGITRNTYKITIKRLDDNKVRDYFTNKGRQLTLAMTQNKWDEPCNDLESWSGARCRGYCDVAIYCSKGILHQQGGK